MMRELLKQSGADKDLKVDHPANPLKIQNQYGEKSERGSDMRKVQRLKTNTKKPGSGYDGKRKDERQGPGTEIHRDPKMSYVGPDPKRPLSQDPNEMQDLGNGPGVKK
ncbi:hypothetical protein GCWU000341_02269 [Oribacterium sp. oral taxon 078 str. F0262]|nr:hypothetical protein GCWU000341_02269 [Oribacterium sp. oral taxon 078 str. F0262]